MSPLRNPARAPIAEPAEVSAARVACQAAQAEYERTSTAHNAALHARAKAAHDARAAGEPWETIGVDLGGIAVSTVKMLARRYSQAIAAGTTVALNRKKDR